VSIATQNYILKTRNYNLIAAMLQRR